MSTPLTQGLAAFVAAPPFAQVPDDLLALLRNAFIDTLACLFSGRDEPVTRAALALVAERGSRPQVHAWCGGQRLAVADAAFVHAVAAHALDFDDMALNGHPSVALVPALLAAAEAAGASDAQLLRAYLVGYEVWAELARREPDSLHNKGWHPTGVLGTVAVAAAVAHLRGLDARACAHALGLAASLASGLMGNFGSMAKPLHAGWAAADGVQAATLAGLGATASANVLEGPNGFLAALSPQGRADRSDWQAPTELRMRSVGLSIKKYPVCYAAHRVIDGVLDLKRQHGFAAEQVRRCTAQLSDVTARVLHAHRPQTALEAKFSIEAACAIAALDGNVGLPQVTDAQVQRPALQALLERVQVETVAPGCPIEPGFALHDAVRIELQDGRVLDSGPIRFARGHGQLPLAPDELLRKWRDCLAVQPDEQDALLARLQALGQGTGQSLAAWLHTL